MRRLRALILIPAMLMAFISADAFAQGRGKAKQRSQNNGPAFCRSGQGHPVHGWQWCADRGWDRNGNRDARRARNGRVSDRDGDRMNRTGRRSIGYENGYSDGYDKGLEDADRNRDFDPTRHSWYRNAVRGHEDEYGTKAEYKNIYRDGFRAGYEAGFNDRDRNDENRRVGTRDSDDADDGRTGTARRRWPF